MIRTTVMAFTLDDVPSSWIFEKYLLLPEALSGQDVKLKSVFSKKDEDPSMCVYCTENGEYKFKDFSADKQGDALELVKELFGLKKRYDASVKIIADYNNFLLNCDVDYKIAEFKTQAKYEVSSFEIRKWSNFDKKYWMDYKIQFKLLEFFNVRPLTFFKLKKKGENKELVIRGLRIYGFFKKDGSLYKIYQPLHKNKFFKVKSYTQGSEQLTYDKPYLIICSSLKDAMSFVKLGFKNAEVIAPDSENTMLSEKSITFLKKKYKKVCTLFDNDEPGIKAMIKYKEKYNLSGIHLKLEKDLARCNKIHGIRNTRELIYPILTKALTGTLKFLP